MPVPRVVAQLNKRGLNKLMLRIAPHVPWMGVLTHRGRRSGVEHVVPVNVFWIDGEGSVGVRLALTYGSGSDWVQNVLAAGGCRLRTLRGDLALTSPLLVRDPDREGIRPFESFVLGLLRVDEFLDLDVLVEVRGHDVSSAGAGSPGARW